MRGAAVVFPYLKAMEVLVEAASEIPQGCFVSVRLGDSLKQRRFDKNSAKYYFPTPEEKRKARIDVYQLVGTCSVPVDPAAAGESNDVSVISSDPKSAGMKLKVSTSNKDVKPAEVAKHRQDIETEAKEGAVGYLAKHGIEQLLSDSLKTMLRMKPEDPIEFLCKYLRAEGSKPREPTEGVKPEVQAAPCTAPFALRPSVGTWYMPLKTPVSSPAVVAPAPAPEPTASAAPAAAPEPVASLPGPSFALRPSVGTWYTPLVQEEKSDGLWNAPRMLNIKGLGRSVAECCEAERVLTKALLEMDGELMGEYFSFSSHPLKPSGLSSEETAMLKSNKLLFSTSEAQGRGVYLTENGNIALLLNADKHLQILVKKSAKAAAQKIDTVVSALQGPLCQDGYVLSP